MWLRHHPLHYDVCRFHYEELVLRGTSQRTLRSCEEAHGRYGGRERRYIARRTSKRRLLPCFFFPSLAFSARSPPLLLTQAGLQSPLADARAAHGPRHLQ